MKIEKAECSYQVTECDLKFGEQIVLDGELLIPASVLDKIRAEATSLKISYTDHDKDTYRRGVNDVLQIIDKYSTERGKRMTRFEKWVKDTNIPIQLQVAFICKHYDSNCESCLLNHICTNDKKAYDYLNAESEE